jgi:photosystem II stability/assembly factor-like uncharacterized protein
MGESVLVLVGTRKGLFILRSDDDRRSWSLKGPLCETWPINHAVSDSSGVIYAGGGSEWLGPAVWRSDDLGATWTYSRDGLGYEAGEAPIKSVWSVAPSGGRLYAGVEPAGLFASDDGGRTWSHVAGLRDHPSRPEWQPGGGGLILHSIVTDPQDAGRLWVGISSAGVFHSADGGATWEPRNRGTRADYMPEGHRHPEFGQCVHSVAMAPGMPDRLYQQNHCGMYRSDDGGRSWASIEKGLPSSFGFPTAVHPRDPDTVYMLPLNGDIAGRYMPDARTAVWRSRDAGASWRALREGLPQENAFFGVLRQALATDSREPAGVYFGTGSGALFASADEGESWRCIAQHLPTITSVETLVVDR